jgi:hypothetical protein
MEYRMPFLPDFMNLHAVLYYPWQFAKKGQIIFGAVAKGNRQLPLSF